MKSENFYPPLRVDNQSLSGNGLRDYQMMARAIMHISSPDFGEPRLVQEHKNKLRLQVLETLYHRYYDGKITSELQATLVYLANEAHSLFTATDFAVEPEKLGHEVALDIIEDALNFHFCYSMAKKITLGGGEAVQNLLRSFFIHYKDETQLGLIKAYLHEFAEGINEKKRVPLESGVLIKTVKFQFGEPLPKAKKPKIEPHSGKWFKKSASIRNSKRRFVEPLLPKNNQVAGV